MNFKVRLLFAAALMSSPVYGVELSNYPELLNETEMSVASEEPSRSFFRPKTMEDVRDIASLKADEMKVLNDSYQEPNL